MSQRLLVWLVTALQYETCLSCVLVVRTARVQQQWKLGNCVCPVLTYCTAIRLGLHVLDLGLWLLKLTLAHHLLMLWGTFIPLFYRHLLIVELWAWTEWMDKGAKHSLQDLYCSLLIWSYVKVYLVKIKSYDFDINSLIWCIQFTSRGMINFSAVRQQQM